MLLPAVAAFVVAAVWFISETVTWDEFQWVFIGLGGYLLIYPLLRSANLKFVEIFEHELGHMVTNLSIFRTIEEFRVNPEKDKSWVTSDGRANGGCFTTLAPYYLSVFTAPLILIRPFVGPTFQSIVDVGIGITLGFHFVGLLREFDVRQSDIKKNTLPLSLVVTVVLNVMLIVVLIVVVLEDFGLLRVYLEQVLATSTAFYQSALEWLHSTFFASSLPNDIGAFRANIVGKAAVWRNSALINLSTKG